MYRQTSTCVYTCGRANGTHGDVLNVHTEERRRGGHRQFCLPKFAHVGLSRAPEVQQRNPCMLPIFSLRIGREQHVPDSSNYSLHLNTLFNSRHMTQRHTQTRTDNTRYTAHTTTQHRTRHSTEAKRREEEMKETKRDRDEKRYK